MLFRAGDRDQAKQSVPSSAGTQGAIGDVLHPGKALFQLFEVGDLRILFRVDVYADQSAVSNQPVLFAVREYAAGSDAGQ